MSDAGDVFEPEWSAQLPTDATSLDDAAVIYAELGFRVLPVWGVRKGRDGSMRCLCGQAECKKGKHPIGGNWHKLATSDVDKVRAARAGKPLSNVGLAMGGPDRLVALDIDGPAGRASLEALEATHGPLPRTLASRSGREDGGEHRLFRLPEALDMARLRNRAKVNGLEGLDTRIDGGQIVVAPSVHESGARYAWTERAPIADIPTWLFEAIATPLATVHALPTKRPPSAPRSSPGTVSGIASNARKYVDVALERAASEIAQAGSGNRNDKLFAKACTIFEYYLGEGFDQSEAWARLAQAGLACGLPESEVTVTLGKAKRRATTPRRAPALPDRVDDYKPDGDEPAVEPADLPDEDEDPDPAWDVDLEHDAKGHLRHSLGNLVTILGRHPEWRDVVVWDSFQQTIVKTRRPPMRPGDVPTKYELGEWVDADTLRTIAWISRTYGIEPNARAVEDALVVVAERRAVHPVRDYLDALTWDGTARLDSFLSRYFSTADTEYTRGVGSRWMISAVARVYEPGCDVDCVLVLEGVKSRRQEGQGAGKSKGLRDLVPERPWFADTPLVIGDKDSYQNLRGKWIYEMGELSGLKGRDVDRTKNFLSASVDNLRPSFGKRNRDFVRHLVFAATTNDSQYLVDRTGNRRFWPVRVLGDVDRDAIKADRDQLWAEARDRYRKGEAWHADTPEFRALAVAEQAERTPDSPWLGAVERWLRNPVVTIYDSTDGRPVTTIADLSPTGSGVSTTEVLQSAINMRLTDIGRQHETEIGTLLSELGLEAYRPHGGGRQRRYRWPEDDTPAPSNGGEGGWTGVGREKSIKDHTDTTPVQPVLPICSPTQEGNISEITLQTPREVANPLAGLDSPMFLGGGSDGPEPSSPSPEVIEAPRATSADRRALDAILARARVKAEPSNAPRAPVEPPRAPTPAPAPRSAVLAPVPAARRALGRLPLDEEDDSFAGWLESQGIGGEG